MTIKVQTDTEDGIKLLFKICEIIMHRLEINRGERKLINGETLEGFDSTICETSKVMFSFLKDYEDTYGGGYMDMGASRSLRLIAENDVSDFNMINLFQNYKTIVNKLVLLDAGRSGQEELSKFAYYCSQHSTKREVA